jgi:hypothetical protein
MAGRLIDLPLGLADLEVWDAWDNRLAFATIVPRLLAPATGRRRGRIRTLFYLDLLERAKGATDARGREVRDFLEAYCRQHQSRLLGTSTLASYRERLHLGTSGGKYIGEILTVGLTSKIMASPNGVADGQRILATAQAYIYENYHTGIAIYANEFDTRTSWFTWKRVAHLCAAFVDSLPLSASPQIDNETLSNLERNMGSFATTAIYYQRFLSGQRVIGDAEIPARSRHSIKLALLPELKLIAPDYAKSDLPTWDRQRDERRP